MTAEITLQKDGWSTDVEAALEQTTLQAQRKDNKFVVTGCTNRHILALELLLKGKARVVVLETSHHQLV